MSGRGAYYRAKYGGGRGRGYGGGGGGHGNHPPHPQQQQQQQQQQPANDQPRSWNNLISLIDTINGQQYGAYKSLLGRFVHARDSPTFELSVDHVQGDAFAVPSRVRAIIPWRETGLDKAYYLQSRIREIALCDYITRVAAYFIRENQLNHSLETAPGYSGSWAGPKGGAFSINAPGQQVLPRSSCVVKNEAIELRFTTSLPAAGRTILGREARAILCVKVVELVRLCLLRPNLNESSLRAHIVTVENQQGLRDQLVHRDLAAFIADGSILPRSSGASDVPMDISKVVPFKSPDSLRQSFRLANGQAVTGMGVRRGITVLTGGGFHGKSTLLEALQLGCYNHIPGDGRELVVADPTAVKIRAEDGRSVSELNISPLIETLPGGTVTTRFTSGDASGSTSMAANIQEALESNCKTLLIDEDSSATNLLVRDDRMKALVFHEPIKPLISRVNALFTQHGVSTIIVIGGLGDWLSVADVVVSIVDYLPRNATAIAKQVIADHPSHVDISSSYEFPSPRTFDLDLSGMRTPYARSRRLIDMKPLVKNPVDDPAAEDSSIDISGLEQIVETGQARMIAAELTRVASQGGDRVNGEDTLVRPIDAALLEGDLVAVRGHEIRAALARARGSILTVR